MVVLPIPSEIILVVFCDLPPRNTMLSHPSTMASCAFSS